jgi:surface protein
MKILSDLLQTYLIIERIANKASINQHRQKRGQFRGFASSKYQRPYGALLLWGDPGPHPRLRRKAAPGADPNTTMMRTFLRDLPREIRKRTYPFAIRVIYSKAELIAAIDQYMVRGGNSNRMDDYYPIGQWDVSNIQDFSYVFDADRNRLLITFNEDLSNWDMSNATNLSHMFQCCRRFNSDVSRWNVSNVTDFSEMFVQCNVFNSDVSRWNTAAATDMNFMFFYCIAFNSDVADWNVLMLQI